MGKRRNIHSLHTGEKSIVSNTFKNSKAKPIKRVNIKTKRSKQQKTSLSKAVEAFVVLIWLVVILVVAFATFSVFIKFFSTLRVLFGTIIASSALFVSAYKIGKKLNLAPKFFEHPDDKTIIEFLKSIKNMFKKFYKRNSFTQKLCIVIAFPVIVSLVLSFIPKISASANEFVDNVWNIVFQLDDDSNDDEDNYAEDSHYKEEDNDYINTTSYPPEMTFIIESEKYSHEIPSDLISEAYLYSIENPWEYFNSIYNTKKSNQNNNIYYMAQKNEDAFVAKVDEGIKYKTLNGQNDIWYSLLPKEDDLRSIIKQQETNAETNPSYHIYYCLSNNYQRLALEYFNQEQNADTIKHFYLMSIKYEIKCMEYATEREQLNKSADRIITRYEDILYCCKCTRTEASYLQTLLSLLKS